MSLPAIKEVKHLSEWRFNYQKAHFYPEDCETAVCGCTVPYVKTDEATSQVFDAKFRCQKCDRKLKRGSGTK